MTWKKVLPLVGVMVVVLGGMFWVWRGPLTSIWTQTVGQKLNPPASGVTSQPVDIKTVFPSGSIPPAYQAIMNSGGSITLKERDYPQPANLKPGEYVMPLHNNSVGPLSSDLMEMNGVIQQFDTSHLVVQVGNQTFNLKLPGDTTSVICKPEYLTSTDGQKVKASQVWIDLSPTQYEGGATTELSLVTADPAFQVNQTVTTLVDVAADGTMSLRLLVGYGCTVL